MKYYFVTTPNKQGKLLSIAIVSEEGREYYAWNSLYTINDVPTNQWPHAVNANWIHPKNIATQVADFLGLYEFVMPQYETKTALGGLIYWNTRKEVTRHPTKPDGEPPLLYGYNPYHLEELLGKGYGGGVKRLNLYEYDEVKKESSALDQARTLMNISSQIHP